MKGVGPARAGMLESKGLRTVSDLVAYAPFRYEDRTRVKTIAQLAPGELATVLATEQASLSTAAKEPGLWKCIANLRVVLDRIARESGRAAADLVQYGVAVMFANSPRRSRCWILATPRSRAAGSS